MDRWKWIGGGAVGLGGLATIGPAVVSNVLGNGYGGYGGTYGGYGGMMGGYGGMMGGYGGFGGPMGGFGGTGGWSLLGFLPLVGLLLLIGGGIYLATRAANRDGKAPASDGALAELRLAYARGDLSDDEFERRREVLRRGVDR